MKQLLQLLKSRKNAKWVGLGVVLLGLVLKIFLPPVGVDDVSGKARVIDGDSLYVAGREVRLQGIDAPEGRQLCSRDGREWACGEESRRTLERLIGGGQVDCKGIEIDQHDRLLALCSLNGLELNREMVARGLAVAYGRFGAEQQAAKTSRKGMWSGDFKMPKDWRRENNIGL